MAHRVVEPNLNLVAVPRIPVEVLHGLRVGEDLGERVEVALLGLAEHEPLGLEPRHARWRNSSRLPHGSSE